MRKIAGQGGKPYRVRDGSCVGSCLRLKPPARPKAVSLGFVFSYMHTTGAAPTFQNLQQSHEVDDGPRICTNLSTQPKLSRCRPRQLPRQRPLASRPGRSLPPPRRLRNGTLLRMRPSRVRYVDAHSFWAILQFSEVLRGAGGGICIRFGCDLTGRPTAVGRGRKRWIYTSFSTWDNSSRCN